MPPNDDAAELRYEKAQYKLISDFSRELGTVVARVKEETAQLLVAYRKDTHATLMAIQWRLQEIDAARDRGQSEAKVYRRLTIGLIIVLIVVNVIVLAYLIGRVQ
jgi:hypothetical protein